MRQLACAAFIAAGLAGSQALAEDVSHPVSDYRVVLYRNGGSADFQGWIRLLNGDKEAGFIYIDNGPPGRPFLGSTKYIVIDIPVAMLDVTVAMLNSGKPVFITYTDGGDPKNASAFLHVGGVGLPGEEQVADIKARFGIDASAALPK